MWGGARRLECLLCGRQEDVKAAGACYRARRVHAALRLCKFHVSHAAQYCWVVQRKASVAAAAATKDGGWLMAGIRLKSWSFVVRSTSTPHPCQVKSRCSQSHVGTVRRTYGGGASPVWPEGCQSALFVGTCFQCSDSWRQEPIFILPATNCAGAIFSLRATVPR